MSQGSALNSPLGLAIAPNGHILTVNGGDGNMVETTPRGQQIAVKTVDNNMGGAGNLFGLAVKPRRRRRLLRRRLRHGQQPAALLLAGTVARAPAYAAGARAAVDRAAPG